MKRCLSLILAVCAVLLLSVTVLTAGAADQYAHDWSVYVMEDNSGGIPGFKAPPEYAYGESGLRITPSADMDSYTVQSDNAYLLDDGFFLEIEVTDITYENVLIFHLWDQSGVLIGNYNCGSGWYGMIAIDGAGNDYMMSLLMEAASSSKSGGTEILGSMKVNTSSKADGTGRYTLSLTDGSLRINGSIIPGMEDALKFLHAKNPDGNAYIGVSIMTADEHETLSGMTVTRFGKTEVVATIPGTDIIPETQAPDTETQEPDAGETTAVTDVGTDKPVSPPDTDPEDSTVPGGSDDPEETTGQGVTIVTRPADEGEESETQSTIDRLKDVYGQANTACQATMSASGLLCVVIMAGGYLGLRKKK